MVTKPGAAVSVAGASRARLLRDILVWHRRRLTRAMAGLPTTRRMLGRDYLSQDDLAQLTGLGIGVIQRLEAGKGRPQPCVLDVVAGALRMYPDERRVLYELALGHPPPGSAFATQPDVGLDHYVGRFNGPAVAVDAVFNVLSCNDHGRVWFPGCGDVDANFARWLLLRPHARHVVLAWPVVAKRTVSRLREVAARFPDHERVTALLRDLRANPVVDELWRGEAGLYHVPMVEATELRRPGHTDPAQVDDAAHRVASLMVTLQSPRLDDERRVIAFAFLNAAEPWLDADAGGDCGACAC